MEGAVVSLVARLDPSPVSGPRPGPPVVVVLGLPGTDPTGRACAFADAVGWTAASFGAALRRELADGTALGRHVATAVRTGELVADHLAVGLARQTLDALADAPGVVLAGFPRTLAQARALSGLAPGAVRWCVSLVAPRTTLMTRVRARAHPDDTDCAVHRRFLTFDRETRPVISAYAQWGLVRFVDVRRDAAEMTARLVAVARDSGVVES
jgi:adenylate kinase